MAKIMTQYQYGSSTIGYAQSHSVTRFQGASDSHLIFRLLTALVIGTRGWKERRKEGGKEGGREGGVGERDEEEQMLLIFGTRRVSL